MSFFQCFLWKCLLANAFLFTGLSLRGESCFFSASDDLGGVMVNRFPYGKTWSEKTTNTSVNIGDDVLNEGENTVEVVILFTKKGGRYVFQFEDAASKRVFDFRIKTSWLGSGDEEEASKGEIEIEWLVPKREKSKFSIPLEHCVELEAQNTDGEGWKFDSKYRECSDFTVPCLSQVVIRLPYESKTGGKLKVPWDGAGRYEEKDFLGLKETALKYASALAEKDFERLESYCDEKWKWRAASAGITYEEQKKMVQDASRKHPNVKLGKVEIFKIETFPLTPLVRISGPQIGLFVNDQPVFLEISFFKKDNVWKIGS